MHLQHNTKHGFSLVETLVAISILLISIAAPLTIASKSLQSNFGAQDQYTATMLAQEGVEAVVSLQRSAQIDALRNNIDQAWDWYDALPSTCKNPNQGCPMDFSGSGATPVVVDSSNCATSANCDLTFDASAGRARYSHNSGDATPFARSIVVVDAGAGNTDQVTVESTVTWQSPHVSGDQFVTLRSTLFNTATTSIDI